MTLTSGTRRFDVGVAILVSVFILTLPLLNPMLRSDAVGYYAFVRSLVIDHDLQFKNEWEHGEKTSAEPPRLFKGDALFVPRTTLPNEYDLTTSTGLTPNRYSIGPALLWTPFFLAAHAVAVTLKAAGWDLATDGYSPLYLYSVAFGSALYAFIGILLIYRIGLHYFSRKVMLFSTVVVWFASSLIAYMYGHPLLSHAVSLFAVSLLLHFWFVRRGARLTIRDTFIVGLLSGLVLSIRLNDGLFCVIPLCGELAHWHSIKRSPIGTAAAEVIRKALAWSAGCGFALAPTVVIGMFLYGRWTLTYYPYAHSAEEFSLVYKWVASSPAFFQVLFSSMHGLFSWTPIIMVSVIGVVLFARRDTFLGAMLLALFAVQVYLYGGWVNNWEEGSSFGARAFINFTPMYILGLAAVTSAARRAVSPLILSAIGVLFVLWNLGFLLQFGLGLIPRWNYIDWGQMVHNQFAVLPGYLGSKFLSRIPLSAGIAALLLVGAVAVCLRERIAVFYRHI